MPGALERGLNAKSERDNGLPSYLANIGDIVLKRKVNRCQAKWERLRTDEAWVELQQAEGDLAFYEANPDGPAVFDDDSEDDHEQEEPNDEDQSMDAVDFDAFRQGQKRKRVANESEGASETLPTRFREELGYEAEDEDEDEDEAEDQYGTS